MAGQQVYDVVVRWKADLTAFERAVKSASASMAKVGKETAEIGKHLTKHFSAEVGLLAGEAMHLAMDFQGAMNKIVGLVGIPRAQVNAWAKDVKALAGETGKSAEALGEALYFITSAGQRGANAIKILDASARAAAAGLGDTVPVADAVTSAINAYGEANLSADQAVGVLVATVREGKMAAEELAGTMGRMLPYSSKLGISFNEIGAGMAVLTRVGLDSAQAATALTGAMAMLMKPTDMTEKALAKVGLTVQELRKKVRDEGLIATLQDLAVALKDDDLAMAQVFENRRALTAVLTITGQQAEKAREITATLAKETGESLETAFRETAGSGRELKKALEEMKLGLEAIGTAILPVVTPQITKFGEALKGLTHWFEALPEAVQSATAKLVLFSAALGPVLWGGGKVLELLAKLLKGFNVLAMGVFVAGKDIVTAFALWAGKAGTLAESLATMGLAAKGALVGLAALAGWEFGKFLDKVTGITTTISQNFAQANPVKTLADEMAASQSVLDTQLALLKKKVLALPAEMGGGEQGLIGLDFLAKNNLEALAEQILKVNAAWAKLIASKAAATGGTGTPGKVVTPEEKPEATFEQVRNAFEDLRAELKKPWINDEALQKGLAKLKAMVPVLDALARKSSDVKDAQEEHRNTLEAVAEIEDEIKKRSSDRLDFELRKIEDQITAQEFSNDLWGVTVRRYDELASAIVKLTRQREGDLAAAQKAYKLDQRRLELEKAHSPEYEKWRRAAALAAQEQEAATAKAIQDIEDEEAQRKAMYLNLVAGMDEHTNQITEAWRGLTESLRQTLSAGIWDGVFTALETGDARDAWKKIWEGYAEIAKDRLKGLTSDLMKGEGWTKSLQNAGLLSETGAVNWGGIAGMAGGLVSSYAQQKQDPWAGALGGALSGASVGSVGGWVGALVGAIIGGVVGYLTTGKADKIGVRAGVNFSELNPSQQLAQQQKQLQMMYDRLRQLQEGGAEGELFPDKPGFSREEQIAKLEAKIEEQKAFVTEMQRRIAEGLLTSFKPGEFFTDVSGPGDEQEKQYARVLREKYRTVSLSIRSLFTDLGAAMPDFKTISAEWHDEVVDFSEWWKKLLEHDLPQVIFSAYLPELKAALLGSEKLKFTTGAAAGVDLSPRMTTELAAVAEASNFEEALKKFQAWMGAIMQVNAMATELGRGVAGMKEDVLADQMTTFRKATAATAEEIAKLSVDLDKMTSEEQVARWGDIATAADAAIQRNRQMVGIIEGVRKSITDSIAGVTEDIATEAAGRAGTAASAEFARGKLTQALQKLSQAADPAALQAASQDVLKWVAALREASNAIREQIAELQDQLLVLAEADKVIAGMGEAMSKPMEQLIAELVRNPTEVWAASVAATQVSITKLKEGLAGLAPADMLDRLQEIGSLQEQQYSANLNYLRDLLAAQQELTASHAAFWQSIEEKNAQEQGPEAYGQLMVDRIKAAMEQLATATDPTEIRKLNADILRWAAQLDQTARDRLKEGGWLGVETAPGVQMSVEQWLAAVLPEAEKLAQDRLKGQVDKVGDANKELAGTITGLSNTIAAKRAEIEAEITKLNEALTALTTTITESLQTALDTSTLKLDGWTAEIEASNQMLLTAITGPGGIGTALVSAAGAQSVNTEAVNASTAGYDDATASVLAFKDAVDAAAGALAGIPTQAAAGSGDVMTGGGSSGGAANGGQALLQQIRRGAVRLYGGGVG